MSHWHVRSTKFSTSHSQCLLLNNHNNLALWLHGQLWAWVVHKWTEQLPVTQKGDDNSAAFGQGPQFWGRSLFLKCAGDVKHCALTGAVGGLKSLQGGFSTCAALLGFPSSVLAVVKAIVGPLHMECYVDDSHGMEKAWCMLLLPSVFPSFGCRIDSWNR